MVRLSRPFAGVPADAVVRQEVTASGLVPLALLAALVAALLVALGAFAPRWAARRAAAAALLPLSAAWVVFNGALEGPVLLTLSRDHGVTVSDLLAVVAVAVAVAVLLRGRRR